MKLLKPALLPSHALLIAVVISLLLSMISVSAIWIQARQVQLGNIADIYLRLQQNVASGITWAEAEQFIQRVDDDPVLLKITDSDPDSTLVRRTFWGLYPMVYSRSVFHKQHASACMLLGTGYNKEPFALYMSDHQSPLSLCGKTTIKGKCFLPRAGVKPGYIERKSFTGNILIDGSIMGSSNELPKKNADITSEISHHLALAIQESSSTNIPDSQFQSFTDKPQYIRLENDAQLQNCKLGGQIFIYCPGKITIHASARLEDVQVYARKIVVQSGFEGSVQLFATDSILVQSYAKLIYPSSVGLLPTGSGKKSSPALVLQSFSLLEGAMLVLNDTTSEPSSAMVGTNAKVDGMVYTEGLLTLSGYVNGMVLCNGFILRMPAGIYQNYLLDAGINRRSLSSFFLFPPFLEVPTRPTTCVKELN